MMPVAVVVGVGPGIGKAVALKFAKEGYSVALVARNINKLEPIKQEIEALTTGQKVACFPSDASDEKSVKGAYKAITSQLGVPSVLIYNAAARRLIVQGICDVSTEEFINFWKINCLGAFFWSREVLPGSYYHITGLNQLFVKK
uniref:Ketoreductase (KR) domain-containing protein n=1 Tax=Arcella intermedia TaxID=1963864 RepID=A0A6B2LNR5_9EUKA